jgi:hypothetical protein
MAGERDADNVAAVEAGEARLAGPRDRGGSAAGPAQAASEGAAA